MPRATPVSVPDDEPIVTVDRLLLVHVPPGIPSPSVAVVPTQAMGDPVIAVGAVITATDVVEKQAAPMVYVMVAEPVVTPVTMPATPVLAIAVLLLLHVPPVVPSVSEVVDPAHISVMPEITVGGGLIVTSVVALQPASV